LQHEHKVEPQFKHNTGQKERVSGYDDKNIWVRNPKGATKTKQNKDMSICKTLKLEAGLPRDRAIMGAAT
jgi:hypothetical protein